MTSFGAQLPQIRTPVPGPKARGCIETLALTECPASTARRARRAEATGAPFDPIVWARAQGANVEDVDGNVFVDLTSGFGAASIGHTHPDVVAAVQAQASRLVHALGDLHPSDKKIALLERLASMGPWNETRVLFGLSGADAVEAALKTALLHTGRPGIIAFEGSYHGLSYGALSVCGYKVEFRNPFDSQLNTHVEFLPYPVDEETLRLVEERLEGRSGSIGAILYEPVLGRGGARPIFKDAPSRLKTAAQKCGAVLIADEILTGLGRTGAEFSPADLICIGKSLGGGVPISACLGDLRVMRAWGTPDKEALHTSTFLGNPLASASALAALDVIERERLRERSARLGSLLLMQLRNALAATAEVVEVRGAGLLCGVEFRQQGRALFVVQKLLERGWLTLPAGAHAETLQLLPPLTIDESLLDTFVTVLVSVLRD